MLHVKVRKPALKDLAALSNNRNLFERLHSIVFQEISASEDLAAFDVKKLKGSADCFRLRVGEHRICYKLDDDGVIVIYRILHRSVAYRYFP
jgi:mRNA interferase RelE/StbE